MTILIFYFLSAKFIIIINSFIFLSGKYNIIYNNILLILVFNKYLKVI